MFERNEIAEMVGKTMVQVVGIVGDSTMAFVDTDGTEYIFTHHQDCCESVTIEDISGDTSDLIGSPISIAEEATNIPEPETPEGADESHTWTFYRFATAKGWVVVRWFGTSNGYYSESVSFDVKPTSKEAK